MAVGYLQVFDYVQDGNDDGKPAENGASRLHQRIHHVQHAQYKEEKRQTRHGLRDGCEAMDPSQGFGDGFQRV